MSSSPIRRLTASALAAGMLLAILPAASFAQDAGSSIIPAGLNADRVDGKHAVGAKASKSKRAGKLVATDSKGFLPSNIVKPKWGYIKNKPAAFRDGRITWKEIIGKPALVTKTSVSIVTGQETVLADAVAEDIVAECPAGAKVVGGGFAQEASALVVTDSYALTPTSWIVWVDNTTSADQTAWADAMCLSTQGVEIASRGGYNPSSKRKK